MMDSRTELSDDDAEFSGDDCVVLPKDYLNSAEAVSEIYEEELADAASNLHVDNLGSDPGFFSGTFIAALLWMIPSTWMVCL